MKKYTHAWLSLKAVELLQNQKGNFKSSTNQYLDKFLEFINDFPSTFIRGAWFPDNVIKDNVQAGHTWKYEFSDQGSVVKYKPPTFNLCLNHVQNDMKKKLKLHTRYSDLPDRCEALSQSIRDMIKITNTLNSGDVISFNNSQIATFFLMLSHYVADAHMPSHCDVRDFYTPSTVHPDIEKYWEKEIIKYYKVSTSHEQFDLDENNNLQIEAEAIGYNSSWLIEIENRLNNSTFTESGSKWYRLLGSGNNNIWDYLVGVCHVSFLMSHHIFPDDGTDYDTVKILNNNTYKNKLKIFSPDFLADAISSIAIVWLSTWMRWELLKKGSK